MIGMRRTALGLVGLSVLMTFAFVFQSSSGITAAPYFGWALTPYLLLLYMTHQARNSHAGTWVVSIGTVVTSLLGLWVACDGLFNISHRTGAQGALVFLFLPVYQWVVVMLVGAVWSVMTRVTNKTLAKMPKNPSQPLPVAPRAPEI